METRPAFDEDVKNQMAWRMHTGRRHATVTMIRHATFALL
jgi:hypothetical protein